VDALTKELCQCCRLALSALLAPQALSLKHQAIDSLRAVLVKAEAAGMEL